MNNLTLKLQQQAERLLRDGEVSTVIGYGRGTVPGKTRPVFITDPGRAEQLTWNPWCAPNLVKYLVEQRVPNGKTAIVVKGCDSRAIVRLLQDNQVARDEIYILGIPCTGQYDYRRARVQPDALRENPEQPGQVLREDLLQEKCRFCENPTPVIYDILLAEAITTRADQTGRFMEVMDLEALPARKKSAYWDRQFSRCLRCHACRKVCPACTCRECVFNQFQPDWVSKRNNLSENTAFHLIRAFHVAGRCVDCGECDRVCPVQIPLRLLNRKILKDSRELFEAPTPGTDMEAMPVLGGFSVVDPDEFM